MKILDLKSFVIEVYYFPFEWIACHIDNIELSFVLWLNGIFKCCSWWLEILIQCHKFWRGWINAAHWLFKFHCIQISSWTFVAKWMKCTEHHCLFYCLNYKVKPVNSMQDRWALHMFMRFCLPHPNCLKNVFQQMLDYSNNGISHRVWWLCGERRTWHSKKLKGKIFEQKRQFKVM